MMKTKSIMPSKSIFAIAGVTLGLLMIPLVGMQFSNEVNWTSSDFVIMGTMIFVTSLLLDLVIRKAGKYRAAGIIAIVVLFLWLWVELAVGLFTNWGSQVDSNRKKPKASFTNTSN